MTTTAAPSPTREAVGEGNRDGLLVRLSVLGIGATMAVWWVLRLRQSFLVDETLTAWVTSDSLTDAWDRSWTFQGNSPVYFCILWFWRQVAGAGEIALRIPSVAATLGATWLVYVMGRHLRDRATGATAAFVFVSTADIVLRATTARPYGFQLLFVTCSTWALMRWTADGRARHAIGWVVSGVAAAYMQPFAALIFVAHAVHLALVHRRHGRPTTRDLIRAGTLAAVLALPLLPQLWSLARRSDSLVITPRPEIADLVALVAPAVAIAALGVGLLVSRRWYLGLDLDDGRHLLVMAWAVVPAGLMFIASHLTGRSVWVLRYLAFVTPGVALTVALVIMGVATSRGRTLAVLALVGFSLFDLGDYAAVTDQEWREAVAWGEEQIGDAPATYLISSALIEAADAELVADPGWRDYFSTPVLHYAPERDAVPLPLNLAGGNLALLDDAIAEVTAQDDRVVLIARTDAVAEVDYTEVVSRRLAELGWAVRPGPDLHRVGVVVFER